MADGAGIPFWDSAPELWDSVSLGGVEIPGLCRVSGSGMRVKTAAKRSAGSDGANVAILGLDVVSFSIEVRLWKEEHLKAFEEIVAMAKPKRRPIKKTETVMEKVFVGQEISFDYKTVNGQELEIVKYEDAYEDRAKKVTKVVGYDIVPLTVSHPVLELFGIHECTVESISLPTEQTPKIWHATIQCREFNRTKTRPVSRPSGGVGLLDGLNLPASKPSTSNSGPQTPR